MHFGGFREEFDQKSTLRIQMKGFRKIFGNAGDPGTYVSEHTSTLNGGLSVSLCHVRRSTRSTTRSRLQCSPVSHASSVMLRVLLFQCTLSFNVIVYSLKF